MWRARPAAGHRGPWPLSRRRSRVRRSSARCLPYSCRSRPRATGGWTAAPPTAPRPRRRQRPRSWAAARGHDRPLVAAGCGPSSGRAPRGAPHPRPPRRAPSDEGSGCALPARPRRGDRPRAEARRWGQPRASRAPWRARCAPGRSRRARARPAGRRRRARARPPRRRTLPASCHRAGPSPASAARWSCTRADRCCPPGPARRGTTRRPSRARAPPRRSRAACRAPRRPRCRRAGRCGRGRPRAPGARRPWLARRRGSAAGRPGRARPVVPVCRPATTDLRTRRASSSCTRATSSRTNTGLTRTSSTPSSLACARSSADSALERKRTGRSGAPARSRRVCTRVKPSHSRSRVSTTSRSGGVAETAATAPSGSWAVRTSKPALRRLTSRTRSESRSASTRRSVLIAGECLDRPGRGDKQSRHGLGDS